MLRRLNDFNIDEVARIANDKAEHNGAFKSEATTCGLQLLTQ